MTGHVDCGQPAAGQERTISTNRRLDSRFIGSFFAMEQLPNDRRPQVAIAGRSNVGKSSLLNQVLSSRKLARVSSTPGRTRSLNFFLVNEKYYLVDLPGYGYAKVPGEVKARWQKLMQQYLTTAEDLIGLILLLDCRREITAQDNQLAAWLAERELPVLVVVTKADKLSRSRLEERLRRVENELGTDVVACSVVSGMGKRELTDAVRELVRRHVKL